MMWLRCLKCNVSFDRHCQFCHADSGGVGMSATTNSDLVTTQLGGGGKRIAEQQRPDSSEQIARDIAKDWGSEGWWHFLHPVVKATIAWLQERNYLVVVDTRALSDHTEGTP